MGQGRGLCCELFCYSPCVALSQVWAQNVWWSVASLCNHGRRPFRAAHSSLSALRVASSEIDDQHLVLGGTPEGLSC